MLMFKMLGTFFQTL